MWRTTQEMGEGWRGRDRKGEENEDGFSLAEATKLGTIKEEDQ